MSGKQNHSITLAHAILGIERRTHKTEGLNPAPPLNLQQFLISTCEKTTLQVVSLIYLAIAAIQIWIQN